MLYLTNVAHKNRNGDIKKLLFFNTVTEYFMGSNPVGLEPIKNE